MTCAHSNCCLDFALLYRCRPDGSLHLTSATGLSETECREVASFSAASSPAAMAAHSSGLFIRQGLGDADRMECPLLRKLPRYQTKSLGMATLHDGRTFFFTQIFLRGVLTITFHYSSPFSVFRSSLEHFLLLSSGERAVGWVIFGSVRRARFPAWLYRVLAFYVIPQLASCFAKKVCSLLVRVR